MAHMTKLNFQPHPPHPFWHWCYLQGPIRSVILNATPLIEVTSSQDLECLSTCRQTQIVVEVLGLPEAVEQRPKFREQFATHKELSLRNALTGFEESRPSPVAPVLLYLDWMTLRHRASKIQGLITFLLTKTPSTGARNQRSQHKNQKARRRHIESHASSSLFCQWDFHLLQLL